MITIANPLYDVVFKYLLEDLDIAKGLLSRIIGEEIESLEVKSQETMQEVVLLEHPALRLLRLDFKAVICIKNPKYEKTKVQNSEPEFLRKKILIELQKAKELFDIMRFRKYLGENYSKEDVYIDEKGVNQTDSLPIISIYFLGFQLKAAPFAVLKIGREIENVLGKQRVSLEQLDPFIELLTHESYMIQVNRLDPFYKTPLENILMLFNQKLVLKHDRQRLQIADDDTDDILVERAQKRLLLAASDEAFRKKMDVEDEIERTIMKKLKEKEVEIAEKEILLEQECQKSKEKDNALAEKEALLEQERQKSAEKDAFIAQLIAEREALNKDKH